MDMLRRGAVVRFGGRPWFMVLTLQALSDICDKFGSVEAMQQEMQSNADDVGGLFRFLCPLVALLVNEGECQRGEKNAIDGEFVMHNTFPSDIKSISEAFALAINRGMSIETEQMDESDVDEVLEEIQKNVPCATETS